MLLVVDVGNTQTHFGLFRDGESTVTEHWRFATVRESTGDELGAALANLLGLRGLSFADVDGSIVSSTVPQLSVQWTADGPALPAGTDARRRSDDQDGDADPLRQPARGRRGPAG